jgi:hypothetical protein
LVTKTCKKCGVEKPVDNFYKNGTWLCKSCYIKQSVNNRYKREYSTSRNKLKKILKEQKNLCCICQINIKNVYHIDHNHKSKKVRGLLCKKCNIGLGMFRDNPAVIFNAYNYLNTRGNYSK